MSLILQNQGSSSPVFRQVSLGACGCCVGISGSPGVHSWRHRSSRCRPNRMAISARCPKGHASNISARGMRKMAGSASRGKYLCEQGEEVIQFTGSREIRVLLYPQGALRIRPGEELCYDAARILRRRMAAIPFPVSLQVVILNLGKQRGESIEVKSMFPRV